MKTQRNILIAFILNLSFSVVEFLGGIFTGSVAIMSDSVHDLGDALSIGMSYLLEKKSRQAPDENHTYGYVRYSVVGGIITTTILLVGSLLVIFNAVKRILNPAEINYNGMITLAVVGAAVNFIAAYFTKEGDSINQKAVNLHMLEDVLGWLVVLVGAIVMRFTDITYIDPLMSLGVAVFILINAVKNMKEVLDLFLEKTPENISVSELREELCKTEGIKDVHHIHVWSIDGHNHLATLHVVANSDFCAVKERVRQELKEHGIVHSTIEIESENEHCHYECCHIEQGESTHHHHHHHHH